MRLIARKMNSSSPDRRHNVTLSRLATQFLKVSPLTLPESLGRLTGIFENGRTTAEGLKRTTTRSRGSDHELSMRRMRFRSTAATGANPAPCARESRGHINRAAPPAGARATADVTTVFSVQHSQLRRRDRRARGVGPSGRVAATTPARLFCFEFSWAGVNAPVTVDRKERVV